MVEQGNRFRHIAHRRVIGVFVLGLLPAMAGDASAGLFASISGAYPIPNSRIRVQALTEEQRLKKVLDAQNTVERNRRCRPEAEKGYAQDMDLCKSRITPENGDARRKCFSAARAEYFRKLGDCTS
jgi:hypothetical protein